MNMKKTIAVIAAGAVAVSAMATTASALEAKTLTYNLVRTVKRDNAIGTITATFSNVQLQAGGAFVIKAVNAQGGDVITVSGRYRNEAGAVDGAFEQLVVTTDKGTTGYKVENEALLNGTKDTVTIPVSAVGTPTSLREAAKADITVTVQYKNLPKDVDSVTKVNEQIAAKKIGISAWSTAAAANAGDGTKVTYKTGTTGGAQVLFMTPKQQEDVNKAMDGVATIEAEWDNDKWVTAGKPATLTVTGFTGESSGANTGIKASDVKGLPTAPVAYTANEMLNNTFILTCTVAGANTAAVWTDQYGQNWTTATLKIVAADGTTEVDAVAGDVITIVGKDGVNKGTTAIAKAKEVSDLLLITAANGDKITITGYTGAVAGAKIWGNDVDVFGGALDNTGATEYKYPYMSALRNNLYGDNFTVAKNEGIGYGDIFNWIGYVNADSSKSTFATDQVVIRESVKAVVNDAIQNYSDVVFTFNTASKKVSIIDSNGWGNPFGSYVDNDWDASDVGDYTSFGRHYWDLDYGYDANTIYIDKDWLGNNLFEGALVINSNLTLSLSASDKFDWTSTSLSFSWDAIQDAALTQNQYANYIQNMVLRTSTMWFWDNMTVTLGATEAEEVDTTSPIEGEEDELGEEEEDEPEVEDEPEEEEEPEVTEPEPEPAPVESNPGTGNAPVALAVIPVALAAAAIVAKKRG